MANVIVIALDEFDFEDRRLKPGDQVYLEVGQASRAVSNGKFCYASNFSETMLKKKVSLASDTPKAHGRASKNGA